VCPQIFLFFFKGAILIGPSAIFLGTLGMPPIEAPPWTPNCKIETNVHPWILPCLVYIRGVELWVNHMGKCQFEATAALWVGCLVPTGLHV